MSYYYPIVFCPKRYKDERPRGDRFLHAMAISHIAHA